MTQRYSHLFDSALRNGVNVMDQVIENYFSGGKEKEVIKLAEIFTLSFSAFQN